MKNKSYLGVDLSNLDLYTYEDANEILNLSLQELEVINSFGCSNYCQNVKKALSNIGFCYKKLGQIEESIKYFEQAKLYNSESTQDIHNIYSELLGHKEISED